MLIVQDGPNVVSALARPRAIYVADKTEKAHLDRPEPRRRFMDKALSSAAYRVVAGLSDFLPRIAAALVLCLFLPAAARAQTDEIQVYTGEINKPGEFSITLHDN